MKRDDAAAVLAAALACLPLQMGAALAADGMQEKIIFMRHGEKPDKGLGQLDCQGFNRALALPKVLEAKFGKPSAIFAPNPLATIEPSAIYFGLPVNTAFGYGEVDELKETLEQPAYRDATVFVAWEHHLIDLLIKKLMIAHGGAEDSVPTWQNSDFDSLYIVTITWDASGPTIEFKQDHEGLDGQKEACPA
jgi:hypothetical protein